MSCDFQNINQNVSSNKNPSKTLPKQIPLSVLTYPNPVSNQPLQIEIQNQSFFGGRLQLLDMNGKTVVTQSISGSTTSIDTNMLSKGIYLLTLKSNRNIIQKKIIVQ